MTAAFAACNGIMQQIRAITLDLDDTLWAIGPVIARAERILQEWLGKHYPRIPELWSAERQLKLREQVFTEHHDRSHDLRFLRETVLRTMATEAGYGDALVDDAFAVFDEQRNTVELFPDTIPGLERLKSGYSLVALTNGNASLEKIGIRHLFDAVISAAGVGVAKPDAKIFHAACDSVSLPPAQVLHVGDHPELDVEGARLVGMPTAWVNRVDADWPDTLPPPDATVTTLHELANALPSAAPG